MNAASEKICKKVSLLAAFGLLFSGALLWAGFDKAMEATNTLEFCISCHEMEQTVYQEYRQSTHYSNASGVRAICADCHVPKAWWPKLLRKIQASQELYHSFIGTIETPEKFESHRPRLAERVWRRMQGTDSLACRNCHDFSKVDFSGQARFAARVHRGAMEKGETCIDCHTGIVHRLPDSKDEALPGDTDQEYDEEYAGEIMDTCAGCHGEYGEGSLDGEYPRLAGLERTYLVRQIELFKNRERLNIPMLPYATERELPGEDVRAIAEYLARLELPSKLAPIEGGDFNAYARLQQSQRILNIPRFAGNVDVGGRLYRRECAGCHGQAGEGDRKRRIPPLTGQHSVYLKRQVGRFRNEERLHDAPEDAEVFRHFGDGEIDDILAWLSVQDDE